MTGSSPRLLQFFLFPKFCKFFLLCSFFTGEKNHKKTNKKQTKKTKKDKKNKKTPKNQQKKTKKNPLVNHHCIFLKQCQVVSLEKKCEQHLINQSINQPIKEFMNSSLQ